MSNPVLAEAIGTIDGVNLDFTTPSAYYSGTVFMYLNGVLVRPADNDGIIELGGNEIRHKEAPKVGDTVHYYYQEGAPTGGSIQGPPDTMQAFELLPEIYGTIHLIPNVIDAVDQTPEDSNPQMIGNEHLSPEIAAVIDLIPDILSVEEV